MITSGNCVPEWMWLRVKAWCFIRRNCIYSRTAERVTISIAVECVLLLTQIITLLLAGSLKSDINFCLIFLC